MLQTKTEPIKTILIIVLGLIVLHLKFQLNWILYVALTISIGSVLSQKISKTIDFLWMKLAWILSLIVPKIVLSIIFYMVLFPIASIAKLFGAKNGILLKNTGTSSFIAINKKFEKSSFEKPW